MSSEDIKLLLVDDVDDNLVALEALLRRDDLEILKAHSGAEALELLLVHDVALALLDVQMPEMDGFELAELMRGAERTKHVPIIFVTAGARDPHRVFKGYETGAVDFLYKPIEPQVLKGKAEVFLELYKQRSELANALRLNEMFVGILGHDLRNPLGAIVAGAHLLSQQLTDPAHLRTVQRMSSAGQRMTDMIEQMLDLTRARLAGGLGFVRVRRAVDVASLVRRTVDELRAAHPEREIVISADTNCGTMGDENRLIQLFSNLVANALSHGTPGGSVSVEVRAEGEELVVRVGNKGVIPPELLPTIFDPFRARQKARASSHGLGLGLYISQQIAVAHGGSVVVESNERAGTVFKVRLPRRVEGQRNAGADTRTVLIVDDDEGIRESLREVLEQEGYVAITASNGREALDILRRGAPRPDVVILDLVMPVIDGARVYRTMQEDPALADIPVIVSSSTPARAPSGVVVMSKPLKLDRLLDAVVEATQPHGAAAARDR